MSIQILTMGVDLPEIGHLMEVSTMFYTCTYCVFTLYGRIGNECRACNPNVYDVIF